MSLEVVPENGESLNGSDRRRQTVPHSGRDDRHIEFKLECSRVKPYIVTTARFPSS
jgi:hypothetical protein